MNITQEIKEDRMRLAMENAKHAIDEGNSPFGAVVCDKEGNVLAQAYNTTKTECDPTAHAEMKALRLAGKKLGTKGVCCQSPFSTAISKFLLQIDENLTKYLDIPYKFSRFS